MNPFVANADIPSFTKLGKTVSPKSDPTRTKTLRGRFSRQMRRRWREVARDVPSLLASVADLPPAQQVEQFMVELKNRERETILERRPMPWTNDFVLPAFTRGVLRGNMELRKLLRQKPIERAVQNALHMWVNQEAVIPALSPDNVNSHIVAGTRAEAFELYAASTWQGLSGVTEQVNTQVAGVLAQSLASRATVAQTAVAINDRIDKIGITRSQLIARTETVEANNAGAVAEYAAAEDIIGEPVLVQWIATLDNRVRPAHLARHGKIFTQDEYLSLIGEPNCRCSGTGYIQSIEGTAELSKAKSFKDMKTGKPINPGGKKKKPAG